MAFCPKCGSRLAENAKFCSGCGNPVAPVAPAPAPAPAKTSKFNWKVFIILLIVGSLILGASIALFIDVVEDDELNLFGLLDSEISASADDDDDDDDDDDNPIAPDPNPIVPGPGTVTPAPGTVTPAPDPVIPSPGPGTVTPAPGPSVTPSSGVVVYQGNGVTISYVGTEEIDGYTVFNMLMQNDTSHPLELYGNSFTVDGIHLDLYLWYDKLPAGETSQFTLEIECDVLDYIGIRKIGTIAFDMEVYNADDYETIIDHAVGTLDTNTISSSTLNRAGETVVDTDGLEIICIGSQIDRWDYTNIYFYIENNTGKDLYIDLDTVYLNGNQYNTGSMIYIPNGAAGYLYDYYSEDELKDLGISSLDFASFVFSAYSSDYAYSLDNLQTQIVKFN